MDRVLILGGTNFIGRNLIEALTKIHEYDLTLFNRGETNPDLFSDINLIKGDRNTSDISEISTKKWDYIIDLSCYYPDQINKTIEAVKHPLKRYILISTCSVYDNAAYNDMLRNEDAPILSCSIEQETDTSPVTYGNRKAKCESILTNSHLPFSIFRPALVFGKYDNTDRFYYWLYQVKNDTEILLPNLGQSQFSVTYVKDLVNVIIQSLNNEKPSKIYTMTTTPTCSIALIKKLATEILKTNPNYTNADSRFLKNNSINQWVDMPLWLDSDFYTYDNSKVLNDFKVTLSDFKSAVQSTIDHFDEMNWPVPKYGISDDRKNELIQLLKHK